MSKKNTQQPKPSEIIQNFLDYFSACQDVYAAAKKEMEMEDAKKQDFIHALEFESNSKERSKIATQMHLSRNRRRQAKDKVLEFEKIVKFMNTEKNKPFFRALKGLIREQQGTEEYLNGERIYKPRGGDADAGNPV